MANLQAALNEESARTEAATILRDPIFPLSGELRLEVSVAERRTRFACKRMLASSLRGRRAPILGV